MHRRHGVASRSRIKGRRSFNLVFSRRDSSRLTWAVVGSVFWLGILLVLTFVIT
jgi:hypothetical protein